MSSVRQMEAAQASLETQLVVDLAKMTERMTQTEQLKGLVPRVTKQRASESRQGDHLPVMMTAPLARGSAEAFGLLTAKVLSLLFVLQDSAADLTRQAMDWREIQGKMTAH
mgnify:CR=1 FL=1